MTRTQSHGSGLARNCTVGKTTYMYVRMPIERKEYRRCLHFANAHLEAQAKYRFSRMALHKLCPSQHIRKVWFSRYQLLTVTSFADISARCTGLLCPGEDKCI